MDASALERAIKALEIRSDSLKSWLAFWVILVVIGVVVEVFVVIKEYLHARSEYRRGTISSPPKPNPWDLFWGLLGGVLVAIGVAGELGIDFVAASVESDLRSANGRLVGLLETANLKLRRDLEAANIESTKRHTELKSAQYDTAVAQKVVAEKQLELARYMEVFRTPRRIVVGSRDGDANIRQERFRDVSRYAGTVALIQSVADAEARQLAKDILAALQISRWNASIVEEAQSHIPTGFNESGVQVLSIGLPSPPKPIPFAAPTHSPTVLASKSLVRLLELDLGPPRLRCSPRVTQ